MSSKLGLFHVVFRAQDTAVYKNVKTIEVDGAKLGVPKPASIEKQAFLLKQFVLEIEGKLGYSVEIGGPDIVKRYNGSRIIVIRCERATTRLLARFPAILEINSITEGGMR